MQVRYDVLIATMHAAARHMVETVQLRLCKVQRCSGRHVPAYEFRRIAVVLAMLPGRVRCDGPGELQQCEAMVE